MGEMTHYDVLGVERTATVDTIKVAYRRLVKQTHPDAGGTTALFVAVQTAWETLSDAEKRRAYDAGGTGRPTPQGEKAQESDRSRQPQEPRIRNMATPPPAGPVLGGSVYYFPSEEYPDWSPAKPKAWPKVWIVLWSVPGLFFVGGSLFEILVASASGPAAVGGATVAAGLSGLFWSLMFGAVILVPVPFAARRRRLRRPPRLPVAGDYLNPVRYREAVHGIPGAGLSAARFGERNASQGRAGEERTDHLLRESVLPAYPGIRVVHGLHWPGTQHADIDHAVIIGTHVVLVDSKLWKDGNYWWDGVDLFRDGTRVPSPKTAKMVASVDTYLGGHHTSAVVLVHTHSGKLDEPKIERQRRTNESHIPMLSPLEFIHHIRHIADSTPDANVVNVPLLQRVLELQK